MNVRAQSRRAGMAGGISGVVAATAVLALTGAAGAAGVGGAAGATGTAGGAGAAGTAVEPASLTRGADPAIPYLVHNVIHDGAARVRATLRGVHERLWAVDGGYVVQDRFQQRQVVRLVFVGTGTHAGEKKEIGRSRLMLTAVVSPDGSRIAWTRGPNDLTRPTRVTVSDPATGTAAASRTFGWARVLGVTRSAVLLTRRDRHTPPTTIWWNHRTHTRTQVADREAVRADLVHNRIVVATGKFDEPAFCNRVAVLSHPHRGLWRSCSWSPHAWSPDGTRVVATHTYFDDVGTDRWLTLQDRDAQQLGAIRGRLDWSAVWEDDDHFLTLALGDSGQAAVIRCTVTGECERASRLFEVGKATSQPNYIAPPVVLASS